MDQPQHDLNVSRDEDDGPVECLGRTFASDQERREHFLAELCEKLRDPEFRSQPGFPEGDDEAILRLSDPPYYTACPNPWLDEFVRHYGRPYDPNEPYHREPFAVDVSEGKTDPLYKAHGYHTKVPHLAIVPSILHYTRPGDLVLDGFCGSGLTGVAAQWCGAAPAEYRHKIESQWREQGQGKPEWGARRAILGDLSPAATFIATGYNLPFDVAAFEETARRILAELADEIGWMYETTHTDGRKGRINYTVWSEVFTCPDCTGEVVFLEQALDPETKRVHDRFPCPHCSSELTKKRMDRFYETRYDAVIGESVQTPKRVPVLINYKVGGATFEKPLDNEDWATLKQIEAMGLPPEVPTGKLPYMHMTHERARMDTVGITHLHHFFLPRQAQALSRLWRKVQEHVDPTLRRMLLFLVEQAIWGMSILARYAPTHYSQVNQYLSGVYYVGSQVVDVSPWYILDGKTKRLSKALQAVPATEGYAGIATGTAAQIDVSDRIIDYIFTDPPFGENIYYADLNFLVESWHKVRTQAEPEAIIDQAKQKGLLDYQRLMQACFAEYHRVLKPGRWMTVVFHNSQNAVWNAIQEAIQAAGFVVAHVAAMDKQQGSYRQVTSTAVKQDLVISTYKPNGGLEDRFERSGGTEAGVWEFVETHLKNLPVFLSRDGRAETLAERQPHFLFDRMVAFHVQRGLPVPLSAAEFREELERRYPLRDGMVFLDQQVTEYERKRATVREVAQLELAVSDEASALEWLRQELERKPQTFQDLQPRFMEITRAGWHKFEKPLELATLLDENFLRYEGEGPVPSQIHSYLSTTFKNLRNREKEDPALQDAAAERWYVPDPYKQADLDQLREKRLLREFETYKNHTGRRLKQVRLEALRAGFKKAWQDKDYQTIIRVAEKIPDRALQEDPKLLMWYDQAVTRTGG